MSAPNICFRTEIRVGIWIPPLSAAFVDSCLCGGSEFGRLQLSDIFLFFFFIQKIGFDISCELYFRESLSISVN